MLNRLQDCLDHGTADVQLKAKEVVLEKKFAEYEAKWKQAQKDLAAKQVELDSSKASLQHKEEQLNKIEAELREREAKIEQTKGGVLNKTHEIEAREHDLQKKDWMLKKKKERLVKAGLHTQSLMAQCLQRESCGDCLRHPKCAWCKNPAQCLPHNVNANASIPDAQAFVGFARDTLSPPTYRMSKGFDGSAASDGLISGACHVSDWCSQIANKISVLSLNVFGSDKNNQTMRMDLLIDLLEASDADIVALQEVQPWILNGLLKSNYIKDQYRYTDYGNNHVPGGLLILSRHKIKEVSYFEMVRPGQYHVDERGRLLVSRIQIGQHDLTVATTSLDWRSALSRTKALDFLFQILNAHSHVLLLGDMNFADEAIPETGHIPANFLDIWPLLKEEHQSNDPGFTWDPLRNYYAKTSDPHSSSSRIDRVFLKSQAWMARSIDVVGCSANDVLCVGYKDKHKTWGHLGSHTHFKAPKKNSKTASLLSTLLQKLDSGLDPELKNILVDPKEGSKELSMEERLFPSNHFGLFTQLTRFDAFCP